MKKICGILFALIILITSATGETRIYTYTWEDYDYMVEYPDTYKGSLQVGATLTKYHGSAEHLEIPEIMDNLYTDAIAYCAFENCDTLVSVVIPESVTQIKEYSFIWCDALTTVHLPASLTYMGANPFGVCPSLTTITVAEGNKYFEVIDGVLFANHDGVKKLVVYPAGLTAESYTVPDDVDVIMDNAFRACKSLKSVVIPEGVQIIGKYAFYECDNLESLRFPSSVRTVGEHAIPTHLTGKTEMPVNTTSSNSTLCSVCGGLGLIPCNVCNATGSCRYCDGVGYTSYVSWSDGLEYKDCIYCSNGECSSCGYAMFLPCYSCGVFY